MNLQSTISCSFNKNKGISLIELMVSMALGLFLIGGMMSMYLGTRATDKTRTELSDIDENAQAALHGLRQIIEHAGYRSVENILQFEKPFHTKSDGALDASLTCSDGKKLVVNQALIDKDAGKFTRDNDTDDSITVVYLADHPAQGKLFFDCATNVGAGGSDYPDNYPYGTDISVKSDDDKRLIACSTDKKHDDLDAGDTKEGMTNSVEAVIYNNFFLSAQNGQPKQLVCLGSRSPDTTPYVIADNIDSLQFRYGVVKGAKTIYKNATEVESDNEWEAVMSVQIAILVTSSNDDVLENPKDRVFWLLDKKITKPSTDKHMYKKYTTTIALNNRMVRGFK